jgi:hypothetical protein
MIEKHFLTYALLHYRAIWKKRTSHLNTFTPLRSVKKVKILLFSLFVVYAIL